MERLTFMLPDIRPIGVFRISCAPYYRKSCGPRSASTPYRYNWLQSGATSLVENGRVSPLKVAALTSFPDPCGIDGGEPT